MTSGRSRDLALLLGVLLLGASATEAAQAQDSARDSVVVARDAVLHHLEAGQRLRIEITGGTRRSGRFVGFGKDQVTIGHAEGAEPFSHVPVERLEVVWTRGNSAGKGALIGAGAGLVVGGLLGAFVGKLASSETSDDRTLEGVLVIGGLGAAGGAGLGALVGLVVPRWVQRWP